MSPHLGHHRTRLRGGLRTARRKRIGLPALSNGDPEACRCRVGARIGSGAVDALRPMRSRVPEPGRHLTVARSRSEAARLADQLRGPRAHALATKVGSNKPLEPDTVEVSKTV